LRIVERDLHASELLSGRDVERHGDDAVSDERAGRRGAGAAGLDERLAAGVAELPVGVVRVAVVSAEVTLFGALREAVAAHRGRRWRNRLVDGLGKLLRRGDGGVDRAIRQGVAGSDVAAVDPGAGAADLRRRLRGRLAAAVDAGRIDRTEGRGRLVEILLALR